MRSLSESIFNKNVINQGCRIKLFKSIMEYEKSCDNAFKGLTLDNAEQLFAGAKKNIETYLFIRRCKQIQDGITGDTE